MLKINYFLSKNKSGFTIIELLVVIAVIGILASITFPRISGINEKSKLAADQTTVRNLNSVTSIYRQLNSSDQFSNQTNTNETLLQLLVDKNYISDDLETQSENAEFAWMFEEKKWYLLFEDSFYVISSKDGVKLKENYYRAALDGSYKGNSKNILIPASINGENIVDIYQEVFEEKNLSAVKFEAGNQIEKIHKEAFRSNNLKNIEFSETIQEIHWSAFRDNNLTEIHLPSSIKKIEGSAFNGNELDKITVDSTEINIGDNAFGNDRTEEFKSAYNEYGPGTYSWNGEKWTKK